MKYPNVAYGVKKVFLAEILMLIAAGCAIFTTALGAVFVKTAEMASGDPAALMGVAEAGIISSGISTVVFGTGMIVLTIIALVFLLMGTNRASKDETGESKNFKTAFMCIVISLGASVVGGLFTTAVPIISSALNILSQLLSLCGTYFILYGIADFADLVGNTDLAAKARSMVMMIAVLFLLSIVLNAVINLLSGKLGIIGIILFLIYSVLTLIQYILYLSILSKAKNTFASV